jgi:type II secretory pathway pseudopilin PulG
MATAGRNSSTALGRRGDHCQLAAFCRERKRCSFTLIEMLVAMAITLVMMGAVVTLFANISNGVRNRRATTEMSGQLRRVRNVLQQDLQGATCPGQTWQRPESNHGYIEIIEGKYKEGFASKLLDENPNAPPDEGKNLPFPSNPEIDHFASTIPCSNLPFNEPTWATDGGALGDYDDILMLTSRNEHEPFAGRSPTKVRPSVSADANKFGIWGYQTIKSPLAEVVWFAVENPGYTDSISTDPDPTGKHFFAEPGYRTIYRRALLIAPWLNPYRFTDSNGNVTDTFKYDSGTFRAQPGLMRILPKNISLASALAAIVAFQDRYDLSVRLEWDGDIRRWKIMANTLGDLTKRENRFQHFGFRPVPTQNNARPIGREYPFPFISEGSGWLESDVVSVTDPEILAPTSDSKATASRGVTGFFSPIANTGSGYKVRPLAFANSDSCTSPTLRVMLNDDGQVVRIGLEPAPLWGERRGEDVMMTDVLAFDLRVYDPGAPVFASRKVPESTTNFDLDVVVEPSDPGWRGAPPYGAGGAYFDNTDHFRVYGDGLIGNDNKHFQYVGQGAYVDMGYGFDEHFAIDWIHAPGPPPGTPYFNKPKYAPAYASSIAPWFFSRTFLSDVDGLPVLAPGYCVYDTWSFHYENNGINEDGYYYNGQWHRYDAPTRTWIPPPPGLKWREPVDQGVDGLDNDSQFGIDDAHERETVLPYDRPLRGMQVIVRAYERDSRAIRQVRVTQHFMQE